MDISNYSKNKNYFNYLNLIDNKDIILNDSSSDSNGDIGEKINLSVNTVVISDLVCFYSNPTSLGNKIEDLESIVYEHDPDIIFFCETWFSDGTVIQVTDYSCFYRNRLRTRQRRWSMYISSI